MVLDMTSWMQQLEIAALVTAPVCATDDVVQVPPSFLGDPFSASRAATVLPFPYPRQFPPACEVGTHLFVDAISEVRLVFGQIGVCIRLDLRV